MRRLGSFLVASVLASVPCCGRTVLDTVVAGAGGAVGLGGITGTGGAPAAGGVVGTGGGIGTGGVVSTGGSGVPCTQITNSTTCDAQLGCYALFSGELPCNAVPACTNHFVSCVKAPPECCTISCPQTMLPCPSGYVSLLPKDAGPTPAGCVAANKCS